MKRVLVLFVSLALLLPAGLFAAEGAKTPPAKEVKNVWDLPQKGVDFISVDRLLGEDLYNPKGEVVGEITDIYLNQANGRAIYVRVSLGGFLGLEEELHLVPYKALKQLDGRIVVDADREKIAGAPAWKAGIDERKWGQSLHDYYGASAAWQD